MLLLLPFVASLVTQAFGANWAVLAAGSKGYENYRHQADLFHFYQLLLTKGFHSEHIITLAFDDAAAHPDNPFPGKVFNVPDPTGLGVDVYEGVLIDYAGEAVTVENFVGVLLGNGTSGGTGRFLDSSPGDDVFVFYVDHGAPGILEFPDGDAMHAQEFQEVVTTMHAMGKFGRMVVYIEACNSGSILENISSDINVYGVTAVTPDKPSLGMYCGYEAEINGTRMGTCLSDLFAQYTMKYITEGDGTNTMQSFFDTVFDQVASWAALHYNNQLGVQYGDIAGFTNLTLSEFFYPDPDAVFTRSLPPFVLPKAVYSAMRMELVNHLDDYTEATALPLDQGECHWKEMRRATNRLQRKLQDQENIQNVMWKLVKIAKRASGDQDRAWREKRRPRQMNCEKRGHRALVKFCRNGADMTTAYAMQFHQVLVNLCNDESVPWGYNPQLAVDAAKAACESVVGSSDDTDEGVLV